MDSTVTILGTSILALLLAGYLAQHYLPPPTPKIVGIDLGTTYSCIAVYEAVTGKVRVIDVDGHQTIPSIVSFGDQVLVGHDALKRTKQNPEHTLYDAKRFIGKLFSQDELHKEAKRYHFKIIEENGIIKFPVVTHNVTYISPEMVGAEIIKRLRKAAEANLTIPVTKTVMAVPADFDEQQRNFTKQAAMLAGLEVLRIINEPTAAALAYGLNNKGGVNNVLVIDIGGGTSDISLLSVQGGMFSTQSIAGNNHLGGQDFNQRLLSYLQSIIEGKYQEPLDALNLQTLLLAVEEAKLNLTREESTLVNIPLSLRKAKGQHHVTFTYNLTRRTFEKINEDLFAKIVTLIDTVLKPIDVLSSEIDEIVLVGGSTRIPRIRELIKHYFGKAPNTRIDPELAVAYGVAIQAGIIGGVWPLQVSAIEIPFKFKKINVS